MNAQRDGAGLADAARDGVVVGREVLGSGFRCYERLRFVAADSGGKRAPQDILRAGPAAAVLPIDLARQEIVLLDTFARGGMTIITPDVSAFRDAVIKAVPPKFESRWGKGTFERLQSLA